MQSGQALLPLHSRAVWSGGATIAQSRGLVRHRYHCTVAQSGQALLPLHSRAVWSSAATIAQSCSLVRRRYHCTVV
ncbi:hypothetical protein DPMN_000345 [Dreissena polymorpha]|uniref:Uncharacterized protein n=1 Tax=Dreissena polymorpha TaxID=45954 RepID=A0A9D4MFN1_DREPO|nr:hypothetical protein DPMN_000345 [Dreissena polymorpha]